MEHSKPEQWKLTPEQREWLGDPLLMHFFKALIKDKMEEEVRLVLQSDDVMEVWRHQGAVQTLETFIGRLIDLQNMVMEEEQNGHTRRR